MPTEIRWYEPGRILMLTISGEVALNEMRLAFDELSNMLDGVDHVIHFILDSRFVERIPATTVNRLESSYRLIRHRHFGWLGMVGATPISGFWLRLFSKLLGLRYANFSTIEEAAVFLRELDRIQTISTGDENPSV